MTPKGLAKRTAKDTGKAVVHGYTASSRGRAAYDRMMANGTSSSTGSNSENYEEDSNVRKNLQS